MKPEKVKERLLLFYSWFNTNGEKRGVASTNIVTTDFNPLKEDRKNDKRTIGSANIVFDQIIFKTWQIRITKYTCKLFLLLNTEML